MTVEKAQRKSETRPSGPGDATAPVKREPEHRRGAMRDEAGKRIRARSKRTARGPR